MSDVLKAALVVAAAILLGVAALIYFSPYQTCVRAKSDALSNVVNEPGRGAQIQCQEGSPAS